MNFARTNYIKHADVYQALLRSHGSDEPLVVVGYGTDYELEENQAVFVVMEDDKGFYPIHRAGALAHRFLDEKFPEVRTALKKLEGSINEHEMAMLLKPGNQVWADIADDDGRLRQAAQTESLAREYLRGKGLL